MSEKKKEGLALLLEPFPANQIGKLPKPTEAQTKEVRADFKKGMRCAVCGGWHHPKVVHLDYVGHAALTRRLLEADMEWNWEPVAIDENGMPIVDDNGGMWIRLTVCGVTRLGYGDSGGKAGANATKERIGDALRNAAMRFGAALDLWSKEDLNKMDVEEEGEPVDENKPVESINDDQAATISALIDEVGADKGKFLGFFKIKKIYELPGNRYAEAVKLLEAKR